jgi:hypothetical protein
VASVAYTPRFLVTQSSLCGEKAAEAFGWEVVTSSSTLKSTSSEGKSADPAAVPRLSRT